MLAFTTTIVLGLLAAPARSAALPDRSNNEWSSTGGVQIFPQINMTDTDGNFIQAHGGAIIQVQDEFYWFGEDKTGLLTRGTFKNVNCYKSKDMGTWEFAGHVLEPINGTNISSSDIVERPKVIYNDKNDEYVMWFHADNATYGTAEVGVATSKQVDGKYKWRGNFKPLGTDSRDMTVWKDPDNGEAYIIFASDGNANFKIARLDDDFYNVTEQTYIWKNVFWEAPGVLKVDGVYHLLYSKQDGWKPIDNYYMTATSLAGPWSEPKLLAPENFFAYNTQNTYELTVTGPGGTTHLYLGDHWNSNTLGTSTYAWYPLKLDESGLSIDYTIGYSLDVKDGTWKNLKSEKIETEQLILPEGKETVPCPTCDSGKAVNLTTAGEFSFKWNGSPGDKVINFHYTYAGGKQSWKYLDITVDGNYQGHASLESSRNASNYFDASVKATGLKSNSTIRAVLTNRGGAETLVTSLDVFELATNGTG